MITSANHDADAAEFARVPLKHSVPSDGPLFEQTYLRPFERHQEQPQIKLTNFATQPVPPADILTSPFDDDPPTDDAPPLIDPLDPGALLPLPAEAQAEDFYVWPMYPPTGYSGPSGVLPTEYPQDSHFIPVEDRWRIGYPQWDRYGKGHPKLDDYPYAEGNIWNPYKQNMLKGDYPVVGQNTFMILTGISEMLLEHRQVPTATTPFESTPDPNQEEFFGNPNQFFYNHNFVLSLELFHGDASFKQPDWKIKLAPVFNLNYLDVEELGVTNFDVRRGTTRFRNFIALEEWFAEVKLADLSPYYDTASVRAGSQLFISDFRGFIFADVNRSVRLFGTRHANRDQFNLIWFDQTEKDTNSALNSFRDRDQNTLIANYFRQDFIWPGYTTELSFHYNRDQATTQFNKNGFLVRPDPVGVFAPHEINSFYFGWAGNGHINRFNVSHAFYWATGDDTLNPLAGRPQTIDAYMAALELSYDRDWVRYRTSYFFASGDQDPNDLDAQGFDAIFDNPNFAGGEFSYWQRQEVRLFGVALTNRESLLANVRSSKIQGQTNFVNPGLHLINAGLDADITPRLKMISNVNFLWFDQTNSLQTFTFQEELDPFIGTDLSLGLEYRPLLNNNVEIVLGVSGLIPGQGFEDLYNELGDDVGSLYAGFLDLILEY